MKERNMAYLLDVPPTNIKFERERAENYREAALLGYGALLANNIDGRYQLVLDTMSKVLWPAPPQS